MHLSQRSVIGKDPFQASPDRVLEFEVTPLEDGRRSLVRQTATFDPRGLLGRIYWYAVLPVHALLFRGLLRRIAQLGAEGDRPAAA